MWLDQYRIICIEHASAQLPPLQFVINSLEFGVSYAYAAIHTCKICTNTYPKKNCLKTCHF